MPSIHIPLLWNARRSLGLRFFLSEPTLIVRTSGVIVELRLTKPAFKIHEIGLSTFSTIGFEIQIEGKETRLSLLHRIMSTKRLRRLWRRDNVQMIAVSLL